MNPWSRRKFNASRAMNAVASTANKSPRHFDRVPLLISTVGDQTEAAICQPEDSIGTDAHRPPGLFLHKRTQGLTDQTVARSVSSLT